MVLKIVRNPLTSSSIDSLLSDVFGDLPLTAGLEPKSHIAVDVKEHEDRYELHAGLPGVAKEDLRVRVEKGVLTISGERKHIADGSKVRVLHSEIPGGAFERSFVLPKDVDAGKLDAQLSNGILTLTMPKAERSIPRDIPVQ
jgi:HSP20 family protein